MATVFLSYAREDSRRVRPLAAALEKDGHIVWWDEQVPGGDQFTQAIQGALDEADAVVVSWSENSVQSAWVRDEAAYARDRGKLVPVSIDGSLPPLGFREYQAIDLSSWSGRRGSKQLQSLKNAIAAKGSGTPEASSEVTKGAAKPTRPRRLWPIAAAAAFAIVAAAGLLATGVLENPLAATKQDTPSIAVLPFTDLSPQRDKAYFAEGVAEEILSTLAGGEGIRVLGRTSARQIERSADPTDLRNRLGVTHLLEGSARSAGDQLRVNVRLIDTSDGRQVWEEEYQGRPADIFAVQDQIAGAVVQRLRGTLLPQPIRVAQTTNPDVYQTYLAARALMRTRTERSLREAFELAKRVIRSDPKYAPGHALTAELYYLLSDDYAAYGSLPLEQAQKRGGPHARQAIRLAPDASHGYAALGLLDSHTNALRWLQRAIELDPSRADVRVWLGFTLNELGRHDEALAQYRAATEIDPLAFVPVNRFSQALASAGQHQEAATVVRRFVARGGNEALRHPMMVQIATWQADPSAVIRHGRMMLATEQVRHQHLRLAIAAPLYTLGQGLEAAKALLSSQDMHATYYRGDLERLRSIIAARGANIWKSRDAGFAFRQLAGLREWPALAQLYDSRGFTLPEFCEKRPDDAVPFVLALRAQRRPDEAQRVLGCLRQRLSVELRNTARLPQDWPGDLEFRRASVAALDGDRAGAVRWLERAVSRGWLGQPYSSRLTDYRSSTPCAPIAVSLPCSGMWMRRSHVNVPN